MADAKPEGGDPNRIMVFLRIRSAKKDEIKESEGQSYLMEVQADNKTVVLVSEGNKQFNFDHVYDGPSAHNRDIYLKVGRPVIENIFQGFWGTLLVYGQTGTGKSYTMCNFDKGNEGIIPGAMRDIFEHIDADPDRTYTVKFSFIQIYLDKLQDLFNPTRKEELKINRDAKGVGFPGVVERTCTSYDEFFDMYNDGNQYRVITPTKMNPESSRGHAALFIQVKSVPRDDPSGEERNGKLFMIDLAGYERFSKTGVQEGKMKEEAKAINGSLLSLGNVVQSLSERSDHVPWRNAKLTRMLEDAIGGKAKCSIILTAGPSSDHVHETMGTLHFGFRAMSVKTSAEAIVRVDYKKLSEKLKELLSAAENKISTLELEAQKRALEREEAEDSLQNEWARMEARQEEEMKKLMDGGASSDEVERLMKANKLEQEVLREQQEEQRLLITARHEEEIKELNEQELNRVSNEQAKGQEGMSQEMSKLRRELERTKDELERAKIKAKEAETEARRLMSELNDARVVLTKNGIDVTPADDDDDLLGGAPTSPRPPASPAGGALMSNAEMRREMDRRVAAVKTMLEETHMLKLQEVEEPLQEEIQHYRALYEEIRATTDEQLQAQKDALSAMYEQELEETKAKGLDVQEKLKVNHMTIKKSYQQQKESLREECDQLTRQVAMLQEQLDGKGGAAPIAGGGGAGAGGASPPRPGVPSLAEMMIRTKEAERKVEAMQERLQDLESDKDYLKTEKADLEARLREYTGGGPGAADDSNALITAAERMKPAQVRKLKEEHEALKETKENLEKELFKLRAEQALSGPQRVSDESDSDDDAVVTGGGENNSKNLDSREDMFGDVEGLSVFCKKLLAYPYFMGKEKVNSAHEHVLGTLTTDLDEYRRTMRVRIMVLGSQGSGKSSVVKCMTATSVPLMRSAPEVASTLHPQIQVGTVEDMNSTRTEWHSLYVKFEDVGPAGAESSGKGSGLLGRMLGGNSADPARVHIDVVDMPGSNKFWRGMPPQFLPGKNVCYVVAYNLNQPLDAIRDDIGKQLKTIHAGAHRNTARKLGGDTPRIAVCLVGTHRDALRESGSAAVAALLNKIVVSLGNCFFSLRGEDTYGMVLIGNFAVSCSDWTVTGGKGQRPPSSFKELFSFLATTSNRLYDTRPSALIPTSKDSTSHTTYTLQTGGDDPTAMEGPAERTSQLNDTDKRLRKGIVTLLTVLARECKVRWIMPDKEFRELIANHIGVKSDTRGAINAINFICRELVARGVIVTLPGCMYEPKYMPRHKDDLPPDHIPLPRDCCVVLDPLRLLVIYSCFMSPQHFTTVSSEVLKDKNTTYFDVAAMEKLDGAWRTGFVSQSLAQLVTNRFLALTASDAKLMLELLSVMGCGLMLKRDPAMLAPAHFTRPMAPGIVDYMSYLVSNHGDGVSRKYKLNTIPPAFLCRLQTLLVPFSHVPDSRPENGTLDTNWTDGSLLVLDKARLKYGVFGSKVVKDAAFNAQFPVRGLLRVEGDFLYLALTARAPSTAASMLAVKPILNAVHHHITTLCRREFRGVTASYQEMLIAGAETKRPKLPVGIRMILERLGATQDEIDLQVGAIGTMSTPKGTEIEEAIGALPAMLKMEDA